MHSESLLSLPGAPRTARRQRRLGVSEGATFLGDPAGALSPEMA